MQENKAKCSLIGDSHGDDNNILFFLYFFVLVLLSASLERVSGFLYAFFNRIFGSQLLQCKFGGLQLRSLLKRGGVSKGRVCYQKSSSQ